MERKDLVLSLREHWWSGGTGREGLDLRSLGEPLRVLEQFLSLESQTLKRQKGPPKWIPPWIHLLSHI